VPGFVLGSVAIHGASASTISAWYTKDARKETLVEERESTAAGLFAHDEDDIPRVTPEELVELMRGPTPSIVLDVRSRSSYDADGAQIPHSMRVLPDYVTEWAASEPIGRLEVAYYT